MTEEKEAEQEYGVAVDVESFDATDSLESFESVESVELVELVESVEETRAAVLAAWRADRLPGRWPVSADRMAYSR